MEAPAPRSWQIKFADGTIVRVDDLSPAEMGQATNKSAVVSWFDAYENPGVDPDVLYKMILIAAEKHGVEPPAAPSNKADGQALLEMLERCEHVADMPMGPEFPQEPGTPESGSGSGVPGDSDGQKK